MAITTDNYKLAQLELTNSANFPVLLNNTFKTIDKGLTLDVGSSTGTGNDYVLNLGSITLSSANKGISFKFWADKDSNGAVTINGTYHLVKANGNPVKNLKRNAPYTITYDGGTNFFLASGGVDDVNFSASDLLSGKTANNSDGEKVTGTMPNIGQQTATINAGGKVTISKGYLSSNEIITIGTAVGGRTITPGTSSQSVASGSYLLSDVIVEGDANLIAENIKANVTIFGVKGNYAGGEGVSYELGVLVEENEKLKYQGLTFDGKNAVYNGATEDFTPYIYNILSKEPDYSNIDNNAVTPTNELEAGILLEQNGELVIQPISYEGLVPSYESNVETDYEIVSFESVANEPNYGVGIMNKVTTGETATNDGLIQNLDLEAGVLVMKRDKTLAIQMMSFNETIPAKYDAPISTYYVKMFETKENEPVYGGLEYVNN